MFCSYGISNSQDEAVKFKPDPKIYDEFKKYCEKCSDNVSFGGVSTYVINGATVTAKFNVVSKNIENQKMTSEILGSVYNVTVAPDKISIELKNKTDDKTDRKTMLKYSLKILLDELSDNGKIVKKSNDGKFVYIMTLYNFGQIHEYCVDPATGFFEYSNIKSVSAEDPMSGHFDGCCETKYKGWRKN